MEEQRYVHCHEHGEQTYGLICKHLFESCSTQQPVGFHEFDVEDTGRPDAWCNDCEDAWEKTSTEEEREQWFLDCDHKIVCVLCWDKVKEFNQIV